MVDASADGLRFFYRAGDPEAAEAIGSQHLPPFDAFDGLGPTIDRPRDRPWTWDFRSVRVSTVQELWIGTVRYLAEAGASGSRAVLALETVARGDLEIPHADLRLTPGTIERAGDALGRLDRLIVTGRLERIDKSTTRGRQVLENVHARVEMETGDIGLDPVAYYLRGTPVTIDGRGTMRADLRVAAGKLRPPSTLEVSDGELHVDYLDVQASGEGTLSLAAVAPGPSDRDPPWTRPEQAGVGRVVLSADVVSVGVGRGQDAASHLSDGQLTVEVVSTTLDPSAPQPQAEAVVNLRNARVPDVAYYDAFLPPSSPLRFTGGSGTLDCEVRLRAPERSAAIRVALRSDGLEGTVDGHAVRAGMALEADLPTGELDSRRFQLEKATLDLRDVRLLAAGSTEPWSGAVQLAGDVGFDRPLTFDGDVSATLADAMPVIALLAGDRPPVRWVGDLLDLGGVQADARLRVVGDAVTVNNLAIGSGDLAADAQLRFTDRSRAGLLYLTTGRLDVAVELESNGERTWKLRDSRAWYDRKTQDF